MKTRHITRISNQPSLAARCLASAIATLLASHATQAASSSWNVNTATGSWVTAADPPWLGGVVPGDTTITTSPDIATFGFTQAADCVVTVDANRNIGGITFSHTSAKKYTLSGGSLRLTSGGVIQETSASGTHTDTISTAIAIQGDGGTANFAANGGTTTSLLSIGAVTGVSTGTNITTLTLNGTNTGANAVTGVISNGGTGKLALTKAGTGTWTISASNTFSGQLTVEQGILKVGSVNNASTNGVLGNSANSVILGKTAAITGTFEYTGTGTSSTKKFTLADGGSGAFQVDTVAAILTLSGVIDGTGALAKTGAGTLSLSGTNSYSGGTNVTTGALVFAKTAAKTGAITVAGAATLGFGSLDAIDSFASADVNKLFGSDFSGTLANVTMASTSLVGIDTSAGSFNYTLSVPSSTFGLNKLGTNTLTLSGTNAYSGGTMITAGSLAISADANLGSAGTTLTFNGGTLDTGTNSFTLTGRAIATGTVAATINNTSAGKLTVDGAISGTVALTKTGSGTLTLTGSGSTMSGALAPSGGTLEINSGGKLTTGATTYISGGSTVLIGDATTTGILDDTQFLIGASSAGAASNGNSVTVTGAGSKLIRGSGAHRLYLGMTGSGSAGGNNNSLTITNGAYVYSGGGTSDRSIVGNITSTGNVVTVTGAGSEWYVKDSNLYVGNGTGATDGQNKVIIDNSGYLNMGALQEAQIGIGVVANNNSITVTGAGSKWNVANTLKVGSATSTGNTANITSGATLQVQTAAPAVTIGTGIGNAVNFTNSTLAYKGVSSTSSNLLDGNTGATGVGLFTWAGINTFRLDTSTETGGTNYTFANNLGAKNYTGLELYGATTLARAITLDGSNGGSLLFSGATSTVTGGVTLTGPVNITATGTASTLTGLLTGTGSLTKLGSAKLTLNSSASYSGDTTVSAGTLKLNSANASNESSTITIASTGAALELGFSGTDTVAALVIGISPMPPGVYKSNTNATDAGTAIDQIIGTGTLTVSSVPGGGYASWALGKGLGGSNNGALQDPNNNGISNLLEYVLNGSPLLAEAPQLILPTLDASGTNFIFTFTRRVDSTADTSQVFNYGTTLAAWTPLTIPAAAGTYTEIVVGSATGTAPNQVQAVTITLPKGSNTHLFGSLHVTQP